MVLDVDIVIVGAGPAGCATALAALKAGVRRVAIIDRPKPAAYSIGESATPDVAAKLNLLGLSDDLANRGHQPYYGNLSLWAGQRRHDDFLHRAQGHGWHLNRSRFDKDLQQAACDQGVIMLSPAVLDKLRKDKDQWHVSISYQDTVSGSQPKNIRCRYLVDASGRGSTVARRLGVTRKRLDSLVAVTCRLPEGRELKGLTLVESFNAGWWYASCLPDGSAVVALMSDADLIGQQRWREATPFCDQWQQTKELKRRVPLPAQKNIHPTLFAAYSGFLTQATGPAWIAVGDALAAFDPLASSGITNALGDGLAAAPVIVDWLNNQRLDAAEQYALRANTSVSRYLIEWREQYKAEQQWQDHPFWLRRCHN